MFLFLWQQIAQNCQNNNIKIWWISKGWDAVCVIIMVKVNTVMGILHILCWAIKLLWECSFTSLQCHFQLPWCDFPFVQFGCSAAGAVLCYPSAVSSCSSAGPALWGGVGCLHHCMQHLQPWGCALGLGALAVGSTHHVELCLPDALVNKDNSELWD